jgi:23S rRNA pseudouridine2605 synthase
MTMRLNRYLAACGLGSRRAVEALILAGQVQINGKPCADLATQVEATDAVVVAGKPAQLPGKATCLLLNKPPGYLCSRTDPTDKPLVYALLPKELQTLHYVGRLDFLSRGLLLFTDDGELTQALLHPSREVERVYQVMTDRPLDSADLEALRTGLILEDDLKTLPARVRKLDPGWYELTLKEGKNREIRRMMRFLNHKVRDLCRVQYGPIKLGDLEEGSSRLLSKSEIQSLRRSCGLAEA